jgi:hypothetical protein
VVNLYQKLKRQGGVGVEVEMEKRRRKNEGEEIHCLTIQKRKVSNQ